MEEENEERAEETLTESEAEEQAETGETAEEAHREGEFEQLSGLLETLLGKIDKLAEAVAEGFDNSAAIAVESGESVNEDDSTSETANLDAIEDLPGVDELDLSID